MSLSTTIDPYVPESIPFVQYQEQLEFIFQHNKLEEAQYKTSFLAVCGREVYSELKKLFPGTDFKSDALSYQKITETLRKRFDKTDSDVIHSFRFWTRKQSKHEKAEDFVIAVKVLAEKCNFGAFKERAVRDVLVIGVYDHHLQKRLFDEDELTAEKAEKIILNHEISNSRTRYIKDDDDNRVSVIARLGRRDGRSRSRQFRNGNWNRERNRSFSPSRSRSRGRYDQREGRFKDYRSFNKDRSYVCSFCKKRGHTRRFCYQLNGKDTDQASVKFLGSPRELSRPPTPGRSIGNFKRAAQSAQSEEEDEDLPCLMISSVNRVNEPCFVETLIENRRITMEVDCGSAASVISEEMFLRNFRNYQLLDCNKKLAVIDGKRLKVLGKIQVFVQLGNKRHQLYLVVLKCDNDFVPLMGRTWMDCFYDGWRNVFSRPNAIVNSIRKQDDEDVKEEIRSKFSKVFDGDFSNPIVGFEGDLVLREEKPIFKKAYEVPLRLKQKVVEHLDALERDRVITPVETSEWASPVVVVMKKDQSIRLVIDCRVSINKIIVPNTYPLPVVQDIFSTISGSKVFCSLDLAGAYTQLLLSERSKKFMIINTIKGLYAYNRLPQGASSSASIFQKVMDQVLCGIENVSCYLDDVLISGSDIEDCKRTLYLVLERLAKFNIKVNFKKCKFFVTELPFLGHVLTDKGLKPCPQKVETIREAKAPRNISELKAFLGLINFYAKFIPNLSPRIKSLYGLLKKNVKFVWNPECERTFNDCKKFLLRPCLLEHFDPAKPIVLVTDACNYGLGAVISHAFGDEERPICFASFSLNDAQRNYPILHLEALAVVCAVKKFHRFLFGMKFVIFTDHKPLIGIFGKEGKTQISVTRLQRYVLELSIYDYEIIYRPSSKMGNADFCSRFPLPEPVPNNVDREYIKNLNFTEEFPLDCKEIARHTNSDEFLTDILQALRKGWPERIKKSLRDIFSHHHDLEEVEGCVLFQDRVIIPVNMKPKILKMLHANHSGITKMKQLARRTVYWFGLNRDIEDYVKNCKICCQMTPLTKKSAYSPWIPASRPFSRLHADFFYLERKVFLVVVDSFSKWIELEHMKNTTDSRAVIKVMIGIFARFGLPDTLVTDGGPPFNSGSFVEFFEKQGVRIMKSPPYHPESNGQAERMVRLVKDVFKKFLLDPEMLKLDTDLQISYFLFSYRNTVSNADGHFPAEKLLSYKPKTLLDLINPKNSLRRFNTNVHDDHSNVDTSKPECFNDDFAKLSNGDLIYYRNTNSTDIRRWLPAKYLSRISENVFQISLSGRIITAHKQQIKLYSVSRRKASRSLVLQGDKQCNHRKRRREDDFEATEETSDTESEFYGFPADSFIFGNHPNERQSEEIPSRQEPQRVRRSKRNVKKKMKRDYLYY